MEKHFKRKHRFLKSMTGERQPGQHDECERPARMV